MNTKQIIKALEPFAAIVDAMENTRDGPWTCETIHYQGRVIPGCGRKYPKEQDTCPHCSEVQPKDVLIDVAGLKLRRHVWLSDLKRARSVMKRLQKEAGQGKG